MKKLALTFSLQLMLAATTFTAQATLIGDSVNGELLTQAAGTFPVTTATVGSGVEFSKTFLADPSPYAELDVHSDSFTFTYTNPLVGPCGADGSNTACLFNLGLLGFELKDLDWVGNPAGEITGLTLLESTFPENEITGFGFGAHNAWVDFGLPVIPGETVWSATWGIQSSDANNIPEPSIIALLAIGLGFMGLVKIKRN